MHDSVHMYVHRGMLHKQNLPSDMTLQAFWLFECKQTFLAQSLAKSYVHMYVFLNYQLRQCFTFEYL